jgi:hypothetical protein
MATAVPSGKKAHPVYCRCGCGLYPEMKIIGIKIQFVVIVMSVKYLSISEPAFDDILFFHDSCSNKCPLK